MAQITPPASSNQEVWLAIADIAGSVLENIGYDSMTDLLDVPDVSQPDLDAALVTYNADPAAADAAWTQKFANMETAREQGRFDGSRRLKGIVKFVVQELNVVRAANGLAPLDPAQVRTDIRNFIANP